MNYLKFYNGSNVVRKLLEGGPFNDDDQNREYNYLISLGYSSQQAADQIKRDLILDVTDFQSNSVFTDMVLHGFSDSTAASVADNADTVATYAKANNITTDSTGRTLELQYNLMNTTNKTAGKIATQKSGMSRRAAGALAGAAIGVINAADNAAFGDKNFGAQSEAIDSSVHGVSGALLSSGNKYAMAAGVALEGVNFLTKMGGKTVDGFDIDINSSGYGQMGHKASSSSRDFGSAIGLGGIFGRDRIARKLRERNEEAQMALKAADIADNIQFEQEARMNSVDDVLEQNEIALNGGIDTSLLVAKQGAKLQRIQQLKLNTAPEEIIIDTPEEIIIDTIEEPSQVLAAKNGAKLELIEVSEVPNVIPEGELHKNKHDLDLEGITEKGIPVGHLNTDGNPETLAEIKASGGEFILDAEIESEEVIFNKELTDYVEDARKKWHESNLKDTDLALEVGKRIVKELLMNTNDNTDLIPKMEEQL